MCIKLLCICIPTTFLYSNLIIIRLYFTLEDNHLVVFFGYIHERFISYKYLLLQII